MGADVDKMFMPLLGVPVLLRTLTVFQHCGVIDEIVVVAREDDIPRVRDLCAGHGITKLAAVVPGADNRGGSVRAGVSAVSENAALVAVHDGARPLVTEDIIRAAAEKAAERGAAIPAVPVKATIKRADGGVITGTPPREGLFEAQTPQVFKAQLLKDALARGSGAATDEASLAEALGAVIYITEGSYANIKLTTPEDVVIAEALLRTREGIV